MRDSTMSRKKHDTTPVAEAAELAHGLLGEDDAKPVSETRADWIEVLADTPAPDSRHIFSPAVGNLVCERIAAAHRRYTRSLSPSVPADLDDDGGGDVSRRTPGIRAWYRFGDAPAARLRHGWRSCVEPIAHALHHARRVSLSGPCANLAARG